MKKYRAYKDSGVEWIGEIPKDWEVYPALRALNKQKVINKGLLNKNVLSLSYGKIIKRNIETNFGLLPDSFETYQIVYPGNIILRLTDLQNDKRSLRVGLVKEEGIITSAYLCLKPSEIVDEFGYLLLHSYDTLKVFYNIGGGVRQTMRYEDLRRLPVLLPPVSEQLLISKVINYKIHLIDTLIEKKQKQIDLFKEKRASIINQTVTKGLDPNANMKDSGIESLGEIPEHWEVIPLKYLLKEGKEGIKIGPFGSSLKLDIMKPNGYKVYGQENIIKDDFAAGNRFIDETKFDELQAYKIYEGDILVTMMGTTGKAKVTPHEIQTGIMDSHLIRIRTKDDINPHFISLLINNSDYVFFQIKINSKGAIMEGLNSSTIKSLTVAKPPYYEQDIILKHLQVVLEKIDHMVENTRMQIENLKEYRTTLISDVVTGKIDVRDEVIL